MKKKKGGNIWECDFPKFYSRWCCCCGPWWNVLVHLFPLFFFFFSHFTFFFDRQRCSRRESEAGSLLACVYAGAWDSCRDESKIEKSKGKTIRCRCTGGCWNWFFFFLFIYFFIFFFVYFCNDLWELLVKDFPVRSGFSTRWRGDLPAALQTPKFDEAKRKSFFSWGTWKKIEKSCQLD